MVDLLHLCDLAELYIKSTRSRFTTFELVSINQSPGTSLDHLSMSESTSHPSITEKEYLDHIYKQIMILNDQLKDEGIPLPKVPQTMQFHFIGQL